MTFYEKMRLVCLSIPAGRVATYGQIAMLCGAPRNARQVGYGLREGLAGENIPAFRVVNGKGDLTGANSFPQPDMQPARLRRHLKNSEQEERRTDQAYAAELSHRNSPAVAAILPRDQELTGLFHFSGLIFPLPCHSQRSFPLLISCCPQIGLPSHPHQIWISVVGRFCLSILRIFHLRIGGQVAVLP